jgi:hypothetical protein
MVLFATPQTCQLRNFRVWRPGQVAQLSTASRMDGLEWASLSREIFKRERVDCKAAMGT